MKKMILYAAISLSAMAFTPAFAQVRVNVNANIGSQPNWGPGGYDYVDYYYLPDVETYYYVPSRQFIYQSGGNWVFASGLPPAYRNYNLYNGYKVVVNQPKAYLYYPSHKVKYAKYKGYKGQPVKYKSKANGNGNSNGNRNGNGNGRDKGKGRH
ncbi:MAG: hypothetical protein SGI83_17745 [Bacteroidota bacterium]|nr:hypothetical protein [Bacteroidota bacterium]